MRKPPALFTAALLLVLPAVGSAQEPTVSLTAPTTSADAPALLAWPVGSSLAGTRGSHRVEAAVAHPAGDILLIITGHFAQATGLFDRNDQDQRHGQHLTALYVPIDHLELWLRQSTVSNRNDAFLPNTTQNLGDPTLGVKYSYPLSSQLGVGGGLVFTTPTSAHGTGLNTSAFILSAYAAASYVPISWLNLSLNAGYRLDNSRKIFERTLMPVQRFTAGINQDNVILAGLGVDTFFRVGEEMAVGPFAEFTADIAPEVSDSPMRATLGAKWFPFGENAVEIKVGGDLAASGVAKPRSTMAGLPPWEVFGQLVAHLNPPPAVTAGGPAACASDAECAGGQVCVSGFCGLVREVVKEVITEVEKPIPTFTVAGGVFDKATDEPISTATVSFSGVEGSALAVDYKTGTFTSWPLPAGEGLVKVVASAPGFRPSEETVPRGASGEVKNLPFKLQSLNEAATGEIKGSLKDARTGKPVTQGQIFIPVLDQRIEPDNEGKFSATIKAGRYHVLISSRRHVTQKKEIEVRAGDVVILNVDMAPKR